MRIEAEAISLMPCLATSFDGFLGIEAQILRIAHVVSAGSPSSDDSSSLVAGLRLEGDDRAYE